MTAAHLCGTHHGLSGRQSQISRAQCRVKSGTRAADSGEEAAERKSSASPRGKSHTSGAVGENKPRSCEAAGTVAAGSGAASTGDLATQQSPLSHRQQLHCAGACAQTGCATRDACTQSRSRLRTMADSRFIRLTLAGSVPAQSRILPKDGYFLALAASASLSFFRYLAGSFLKSF